MKPGVIRRLHRRSVIAAEGIGKVENVRIKLAQRPARAGEIKQNIMVIATESNRPPAGVNPMQEVSMRLNIKNVLDLA